MSSLSSPPPSPLSPSGRHSGRPAFPQQKPALPDTPVSARKPAKRPVRPYSPTNNSTVSSWFELDSVDSESGEGLDRALGTLTIGALQPRPTGQEVSTVKPTFTHPNSTGPEQLNTILM